MLAVGKGIGVTADPEVQLEKLNPRSLFMVLASDGVFEFMSNQEVVDMVCTPPAPCLLHASCRLHENG